MIQPVSDTHPFHIALLTLYPALTQKPELQKIASLESFSAEWDRLVFTYQGKPAVLIRIPKPDQADPDMLEISPGFYLSAYLLQCPQSSLEVRVHPGNQEKLVCRCHGSVFWAKDGVYFAGVESPNLQRISLVAQGTEVYATTS